MAPQEHNRVPAAHDAAVLERELRIAARPETVFAFFIDPALMLRWMGTDVVVDPRAGGIFYNNIDGQHIARGEYVEVVPHSRVVFTWGWEGQGSEPPPGASTVEITLVADGDGTILRLRHLGLSEAERASHGQGWDYFLARLAAVGEGRDAADAKAT
jgi:uncharacterized protein YndB with AHSA1/START domain